MEEVIPADVRVDNVEFQSLLTHDPAKRWFPRSRNRS